MECECLLLRNALQASDRPVESMNRRPLALKVGLLLGLLTAPFPLGMPMGNRSLFAAAGIGDQLTDAKQAPPKNAPSTANDLALPFRVGEMLNYRVTWAAFAIAASLQVSVLERRNLFGWATWHFRAALHTQSPLRIFFPIDDEFDSYADAATLETRQYETYLDEWGRKDSQLLHFVAVGQRSRAPAPDLRVLAGTRDPLGALYALRGVDWQRTPEFQAPLYDGRNIYQIRARLEAPNESVTVAAGNFSASRIAVGLCQNDRRDPDIHFDLWLANNPARTPVQFQAVLPFGNLRAELASSAK
jgi:hypothetical protein